MSSESNLNEPHTILHYLYVPSSKDGALIASELRARGFRTEERLGADGEKWLVLARREEIPSESTMTSLSRLMEALASKVGGEYDGWEAELIQRDRD